MPDGFRNPGALLFGPGVLGAGRGAGRGPGCWARVWCHSPDGFPEPRGVNQSVRSLERGADFGPVVVHGRGATDRAGGSDRRSDCAPARLPDRRWKADGGA